MFLLYFYRILKILKYKLIYGNVLVYKKYFLYELSYGEVFKRCLKEIIVLVLLREWFRKVFIEMNFGIFMVKMIGFLLKINMI